MHDFQVTIGTQDFTDRYESLTFSNVDPGGFEAATITVSDDSGVYPGQQVFIRHGLAMAWMGRVNEPGPHTLHGAGLRQIVCVGAGIVLKDKRMREIYVDRDMTRWQAPSVQRQINTAGLQNGSPQSAATADDTTGSPSLKQSISTPWAAGARAEAWYDAHGIALGSLYAAVKTGPGTVTGSFFHWFAELSTDDIATTTDSSSDLNTATPNTATVTAGSSNRTFALLPFYYDNAVGGNLVEFALFWTCLAAYGNHGLTKRGSDSATDAKGFYPADIALDAAQRVGGFGKYVIGTDPNGYILAHSVYHDYVPHEKVIDDEAKYLGWHWGVWEPQDVLSEDPSFWFTAPPTDATAWTSVRDCQLDPPKVRLDSLYDTCIVTYTDVTGITRSATVTLSNPLLEQAGLSGKVLDLSIGTSTAARAQDQGTAALALAQTVQRGGGSAVFTRDVGTAGGGTKHPCLLRSGRDRLRITDLPDSGPVNTIDTRRYDTFHIRRVETTITRGQIPSTRVEFDDGADLLEVLQARLAVAATISGQH
jgi:hypothetical protein